MKPWKQNKLVIIIVVVLILWQTVPGEAKCSRLPSGNCWVNCAQDVFDILCNNVTVDMVLSDISVFADTSQLLRLYIWSSPLIERLSASVFAPVAQQLTLLDLQDVTSLDTFPELRDLLNLKRLNIWNSPKLCRLALELLPLSIWKLSINKVCISYLENDFIEVPVLPNLEVLILRNMTLKGLQQDFLKLFPKLLKLEVANNTFQLDFINDEFFETRTVQDFKLAQNDFSYAPKDNTTDFLGKLLRSLKMPAGSVVDLSFNGLEIDDRVIQGLQSQNQVSSLVLRGNTIIKSDSLSGFLAYFTNLQFLDLGQTKLVPVVGLLEGLQAVTTILLDHNNLTDIYHTNIFEGCTATNLTLLDLSYNGLQELPMTSDFVNVAHQIRTLNLDGNALHIFETDQLTPQSQAVFKIFSGLRSLSLAYNKMKSFYGIHLKQLAKLENLDLSCNSFRRITKEMFTGLNENLISLNISFCLYPPQESPASEPDAFSTLPRLKTLSVCSASFKTWVFTLFTKLSTNANETLEELYLDDNDVSFIRSTTIPPLPNLRLLSLKRNRLQSIASGSFATLPELRSLQLNGNRIISLGPNNLDSRSGQLKNLENLDLSNNGLAKILPGAFDQLPQLKSLMLGWNPAEIQNVFTGLGGQKLVYLGIQGYNRSCLRPELFDNLRKLRWILPDVYNIISTNPDARTMKQDQHLQSLISVCIMGQDQPDHTNSLGLKDFIGVTIHDTDEGEGLQYPIIVGWVPLHYCPVDNYVTSLSASICSKATSMGPVDDRD